MLTTLRQEEKYPLKLPEAIRFAEYFAKLLMPDAHSADGSYPVRSLYFDTPDDRDFFDKMTEQNVRRKLRLRIYDPEAETAKLELKQKENQYQKKRSLPVTRADALALAEGSYSVLRNYREPFAEELYAILTTECYRPKSIVEYRRRAFTAKENDIRLTFDSEIRATESSFALFSPTLPLNPVFDADKVILEVKYNRFMPEYLSEIVSGIDRRSISSSKYCLSRAQGYPLYR